MLCLAPDVYILLVLSCCMSICLRDLFHAGALKGRGGLLLIFLVLFGVFLTQHHLKKNHDTRPVVNIGGTHNTTPSTTTLRQHPADVVKSTAGR